MTRRHGRLTPEAGMKRRAVRLVQRVGFAVLIGPPLFVVGGWLLWRFVP